MLDFFSNNEKKNPAKQQEQQPTSTQPPFVKHYQQNNNGTMTAYEIDDSKVWKGETYYYWDTPLHNNKVKWHKHKPSTCRTSIR